MKNKLFYYSIFIGLFFASCGGKDDTMTTATAEWLIPKSEVLDGGPGKDGIPSIDNPKFVSPNLATFLNDNDLIIGYKVGSEIKGYPHKILDWHEIINDEIGGEKIAIVYCPLTGTAIGWNRVINGTETTYGVSGLLYNTNIIPYDRASNSNWSQLRFDCVNGPLIRTPSLNKQVLETSFGAWKEMYPNSLIVSDNTGFNRNYLQYPYGDYRTNNNNLLFSVNGTNSSLPQKERVLGIIINQKNKVYSIENFNSTTSVINDVFEGQNLAIIGNKSKNFIVTFNRKAADDSTLTFTPLQNELPNIVVDNEGNKWDVFGEATTGPRTGQKLTQPLSLIGYWFAFPAFYPDVVVYKP